MSDDVPATRAGSVAFSSSATTLYVVSGAEQQTPRRDILGVLTPIDEATGKVNRSIPLRGVPAYVAFKS